MASTFITTSSSSSAKVCSPSVQAKVHWGESGTMAFWGLLNLLWDVGTQSTTMALLLRGETRESGDKWDSSLGPALSEALGPGRHLLSLPWTMSMPENRGTLSLTESAHWFLCLEERNAVAGRPSPQAGKSWPRSHLMLGQECKVNASQKHGECRGHSPCQSPHLIHHPAPHKPGEPQGGTENFHKVNQVASSLKPFCQIWARGAAPVQGSLPETEVSRPALLSIISLNPVPPSSLPWRCVCWEHSLVNLLCAVLHPGLCFQGIFWVPRPWGYGKRSWNT